MDAQFKRELYDLIADDRIAAAVEKLQDQLPVDHPDFSRIILLARRVRELERKSEDATIALDEATIARNQISEGLLAILRNEPVVPAESGRSDPSPPSPEFVETDPRKMGFFEDVTYGGSPSKKEQILLLDKPYGAAYHACLQALKAAGFDMERSDRAGGWLEASLSGNFITSYGEKALLWLTPVNPGRTKITVVVDSKLPTMVLDWGRNKNKLNAILSHLR